MNAMGFRAVTWVMSARLFKMRCFKTTCLVVQVVLLLFEPTRPKYCRGDNLVQHSLESLTCAVIMARNSAPARFAPFAILGIFYLTGLLGFALALQPELTPGESLSRANSATHLFDDSTFESLGLNSDGVLTRWTRNPSFPSCAQGDIANEALYEWNFGTLGSPRFYEAQHYTESFFLDEGEDFNTVVQPVPLPDETSQETPSTRKRRRKSLSTLVDCAPKDVVSFEFNIGHTEGGIFALVGSMLTRPLAKDFEANLKENGAFKQECLQAIQEAPQSKFKWLSPNDSGQNELKLHPQILQNIVDLLDISFALSEMLLKVFRKTCRLQALGDSRSSFKNWLQNVIIASKDNLLTDEGAEPEVRREEARQIQELRKSLAISLHSDDHWPVWQVSPSRTYRHIREYREPLISLVKASVNLIGSYFKRQEHTKWNRYFSTDSQFLQWLARISVGFDLENSVKGAEHSEDVFVKRRKMYLSSARIWKKPRDWMDHFLCPSTDWVNAYVKELKKDDESSEFHKTLLINPHDEVYVELSYTPKALLTIENLVKEEIVSHLSEKLNEHTWTNAKSPFFRVSEQLAQHVWLLNNIFLGNFGEEEISPVVVFEQNEMQKWLVDKIVGFLKSSKANSTEPQTHKTNSWENYKAQDLIMNFNPAGQPHETFDFPGDHDPWEKKMSGAHNKVLTKAAIQIIGSYYKTQNYKKWRRIFANDERFLSLMIYSRKLKKCRNYLRHMKSQVERINGLRFLPWNSDFPLESLDLQERLNVSLNYMLNENLIEVLPSE